MAQAQVAGKKQQGTRRGKGHSPEDGPQEETGFKVVPVKGDGRCLFRAVALGLAARRGAALRSNQEEEEADRLRLAVADALCRTPERRKDFPEALTVIQAEGTPLKKYCTNLLRADFWGGEAEISVLARLLHVPLAVYVPAGAGGRYRRLALYGSEHSWRKPRPTERARNESGPLPRSPICLLYNGQNHYDLLLA